MELDRLTKLNLAQEMYLKYKNGWRTKKELHVYLFELCDYDIKEAYLLLVALSAR